MQEERNESQDERLVRVEVAPERPPTFTVRATLLDGRQIIGERREEYRNLADALEGLTEIGALLSVGIARETCAAIVPRGDTEPSAAQATNR